ncbi:hypothetical protein GGR54DRAFT_585249 [Hypoxylon sp. NC1633]|nr:hypothetical protein GGR54DRAFT_585249 [Hypoxylon sp. NC1633]
MDPLIMDIQLVAQLALDQWNSNASTQHAGRAPSFGKIHTKSIRSTRTLDSNFMADYHTELDSLRRQWETRVFQYWETSWDSHSIQGSIAPDTPLLYRKDSAFAPSQPLQSSQKLRNRLRGFSMLERNVQQWCRFLELKRHRAKAIDAKRKIDFKYRRQLGLRNCMTSPKDFPTDLDDLACYWDPWYVTEYQPTPYIRSTIGGSYTVSEYYSSDHQLRLRRVHQRNGTDAVKACFKPDHFDKLDVTTLYIYDNRSWS